MSSQDSEGESYVADFIANPKSYGDEGHYSWTSEEEEESVPPRFKNKSMEALRKKIIKLKMDNDELRIDNFILPQKLEEAKGKPSTFSPPPLPWKSEDKISPSSPSKENWVSGMGTPLGFRQAWGRCPGIVPPHYLITFTYFSSIFCFRWIRV